MSATDPYTIRTARPADLPALPAIERASAALFRATPFAFIADFPLASPAIDPLLDLVWVAVDRADRPVGFAIARPLDGDLYLCELDVHPDHGRRGLGRRLIAAAADWARQHRFPGLTLRTFRDIPWNGPFYAQLDFRPILDADLSPGLRAICEAEVAGGLPSEARICMRRDIAPRAPYTSASS